MPALKASGKIKSSTFSFNHRGYNGDSSTFDLGDPVFANMQGNSAAGAITFDMNDDFFWSISV